MIINNAMIGELSTSQKLENTNYDMQKWKTWYLLNERDLLEHLTVPKFPTLNKDKYGKPIDTTTAKC